MRLLSLPGMQRPCENLNIHSIENVLADDKYSR